MKDFARVVHLECDTKNYSGGNEMIRLARSDSNYSRAETRLMAAAGVGNASSDDGLDELDRKILEDMRSEGCQN
jgi:hypothetical protein